MKGTSEKDGEVDSDDDESSAKKKSSAKAESEKILTLEEEKDLEEKKKKKKILSSTMKNRNVFKSLWKFKCNETKNKNVNCMSWNKQNREILAVGYGNVNFVGEKDGLILCWSVKNPIHPERKIYIKNKGVACIDFCENHPYLLSAGLNDGTVCIYDVRKRDNEPVLTTSKNHNGTVWDMQWVRRGKIGERLHTVGVDGRVNAWSIKKGLDCQEIMRLRKSGSGPSDVSRETGGLCMDFHKNDPMIYLVGSEDGTIYKCSCSYNEQYLQTFSGHNGAVYKVKWNPKVKTQFISCAADWTVRVWDEARKEDPLLLTIQPYSNFGNKQTSIVTDIAWNPYVERVFGCVSLNGMVELWDMNLSTLKPRISRYTRDVKFTSILFAQKSSAMLVGNDLGEVEVLKPQNLFRKKKKKKF